MKQESQSFLYAINVGDSGTLEGIMPQMPTSGVELVLTEIGKNEIGITTIPLCGKCRN